MQEDVPLIRASPAIAQDLHDVLGLNLTAVLWQLNAAEGLFVNNEIPAARQFVARAKAITAQALRDIRCAVEPDDDPDAGSIARGLETVVRTATFGSQVCARLTCRAPPPELPAGLCIQAKRITLEAVTNAVRHAQATAIDVEVACRPGEVVITVRDDGRGFVVARAEADGGFGLLGMRKRAFRIGASLTVQSVPGAGTEIRLTIPTARARAP